MEEILLENEVILQELQSNLTIQDTMSQPFQEFLVTKKKKVTTGFKGMKNFFQKNEKYDFLIDHGITVFE